MALSVEGLALEILAETIRAKAAALRRQQHTPPWLKKAREVQPPLRDNVLIAPYSHFAEFLSLRISYQAFIEIVESGGVEIKVGDKRVGLIEQDLKARGKYEEARY